MMTKHLVICNNSIDPTEAHANVNELSRPLALYRLTLACADSTGGLVFGIPISQCLENDRLARIAAGEVVDVGCLSRSSRHGSRASFTSLIETPTTASKTDEVS